MRSLVFWDPLAMKRWQKEIQAWLWDPAAPAQAVRVPLFDLAFLNRWLFIFFQREAAGGGNWLHKGRQSALQGRCINLLGGELVNGWAP